MRVIEISMGGEVSVFINTDASTNLIENALEVVRYANDDVIGKFIKIINMTNYTAELANTTAETYYY